MPKEKIRPLLSFIDHLIELPEKDTEQLLEKLSPLIEGDTIMSLTLDDTSFTKYFKKIGREDGLEEGRREGKVEGKKEALKETAQKMLLEGFGLDVVIKVTRLSNEEVTKLKETK